MFAVSGALAGERLGLDLLGIVVLAAVTAIGGGTLRDLLMRREVFWLRDARLLVVILAATAATIAITRVMPLPVAALRIADALGLAMFAIAGAQVAHSAGLPALVSIVLGTMTGAGGGVLRDVLGAQVPAILRSDFYASAAVIGIAVYLALLALRAPRPLAVSSGVASIAALRLGAIAWGWHLPTFALPS